MRLAGFRYLESRRLLALAALVALSSMLFSMTALALMGYYRGFYAYLGEGEDVVVVYDRGSRTPFTGIVPAYLAGVVRGVDGVLAVSPEVVVPCVVKGRPVFLRGVVLEDFLGLERLEVVRGGMLDAMDLNSAMVGERLAERLGLEPGERILVVGVLTGSFFELEVKGVFRSGSPLDDEIVAPLHVGQWLRGSGYDYVTLIRVKVDRGRASKSSVLEVVAKEATGTGSSSQVPQSPPVPGQPFVPWRRVQFQAGSVGVEEAQRFMRSYLERYDVTRESLLVLSAVVFLLSGSTVVLAVDTVIAQHRGELAALRYIGASRRLLKMDVLAKLLPLAVAASLVGVVAASLVLSVIQGYGYFQVLSHTVFFEFDPLVLVLDLALTSILVSAGVLRSKVGD